MPATITIPLEEFDTIRNRVVELSKEATQLREELKKANLVDPTGRVPALIAAINGVLPIIRFAVGNLDPEIVRGWPHAALKSFAEAIQSLPAVEDGDNLGAELKVFAREAAEWERYRAERTKNS